MTDSREKGARAEREIVAMLNVNGFPQAARLRTPGEAQDRGDISGMRGLTVEVKNQERFEPLAWIRQMWAARERADTRWGVVFARRRGGVWLAVMPVDQFIDLYRAALDSGPGTRMSSAREWRET